MKSIPFSMMMKYKQLLLILILSIPVHAYSAQKSHFDIKEREQELVMIRKKAIAAIRADNNWDVYEKEMTHFKKVLKETLHHKTSLVYPFDSLKKYIDIQTSADGKIRFYSWMPSGGGTWKHFDHFIQFKRNDGFIEIIEKKKDDLEYDIAQVRVLPVSGKKDIYITFGWGTHGGGGGYTVIDTWKINDKGLEKADILDTNGLYCSHFVDLEKGRMIISTWRALDFSNSHIVYDSAMKTILFDYYELSPATKNFDALLMRTNKAIRMQFNGRVFKRVDC